VRIDGPEKVRQGSRSAQQTFGTSVASIIPKGHQLRSCLSLPTVGRLLFPATAVRTEPSVPGA